MINVFPSGTKNRTVSKGKEREAVMERLTMHVLDTAGGRRAAGLLLPPLPQPIAGADDHGA